MRTTTATTNNDLNNTAATRAKHAIRSFWLLGLLNNAPWVLMLACATNISSGGVALIFLANQAPGLITKLTSPFWFYKVSYRRRMGMASVAMGVACLLVGYGGLFNDEHEDGNAAADNTTREKHGLVLELLGVSFTSFQCSLGEASLLALAGKFDSLLPSQQQSHSSDNSSRKAIRTSSLDSYSAVERNDNNDEHLFSQEYPSLSQDSEMQESSSSSSVLMKNDTQKQKQQCITAFASGTGLAGIVGYAYKSILSDVFGWRLSYIVWSAILFAIFYWWIYCVGLYQMEMELDMQQHDGGSSARSNDTSLETEMVAGVINNGDNDNNSPLGYDGGGSSSTLEMVTNQQQQRGVDEENDSPLLLPSQHSTQPATTTKSVHEMTTSDKFYAVLSLWPYMIPLFFVYMTEYMMQAGVWPAIGFPVESASARAQFYHYSNWIYQAGVFVSRSSGNCCTVPMIVLWIMPALQGLNLIIFWIISVHHVWYNYSLLILCLIAGLLGGSVYVQGYNRINLDMPKEMREFAISSASVADSFGILVADICSLYIQSCIYERNGIEGAVVTCPF